MILIAKKSRTAKIKTPIFDYTWYKEINKVETNKKFIQDQIDSFILLVDNKDKINPSDFRDELKTFISLIPSQGHLVKLDKEYQEKFFRIAEYLNKQFNVGISIVSLRH